MKRYKGEVWKGLSEGVSDPVEVGVGHLPVFPTFNTLSLILWGLLERLYHAGMINC